MPRVNHVKACRKAQGPCPKCGTAINPGDPYLWWEFRYGGKHVRCTNCPPRASELTQSAFLAMIYDAQDFQASITENDQIQDLIDMIAEARDLAQESLDNMPEQLQEGDTGIMLQERVEACEQWISELEDLIDNDEVDWHDELAAIDYQGE